MKRFLSYGTLILFVTVSEFAQAQFGYGNGYGRQGRSAIPQAQTPPPEPESKTAEEYVDEQMPKIVEALELNAFEEAVMRSTFEKYVQKRIELQILQLEPKKMKEEYEKLNELQNEELKAGLPEEKYNAFLELQEKGFKKKKKKKKKS
ncbi:MAG: hypothetical protein AAGB24_05150 [Bacteroidota bacterium]